MQSFGMNPLTAAAGRDGAKEIKYIQRDSSSVP